MRWPSLLLVAACTVMALIKLYERHERARFMANHPVMIRLEHPALRPPRWPEDNEPFRKALTFETNFTAGNTVRFRNKRNFTVLYPRHDAYLREKLVRGVMWEAEFLDYLCSFVIPGSVVVDIGANLGNHALAFSDSVGPQGRVVAFEPQQFMMQILAANLVHNDILNVEVHHAAVAHKSGFTTLQGTVPDGSYGENHTSIADAIVNGSRVNFGGVGIGSGGEVVRCWALDDLQLTNVSLLKVDAIVMVIMLCQEGAEPLVAFGARQTIRSSRPVISFEQRRDKPVSPAMIAALDVPDEVARFDLAEFCVKSLNYTVRKPPGAGRGDLMLIPEDVAVSRGWEPDH